MMMGWPPPNDFLSFILFIYQSSLAPPPARAGHSLSNCLKDNPITWFSPISSVTCSPFLPTTWHCRTSVESRAMQGCTLPLLSSNLLQ